MRAEELLYKFNSQNPHATMLSEDQDNYKRKELQTKKYYVLFLSVDCIFIVIFEILSSLTMIKMNPVNQLKYWFISEEMIVGLIGVYCFYNTINEMKLGHVYEWKKMKQWTSLYIGMYYLQIIIIFINMYIYLH